MPRGGQAGCPSYGLRLRRWASSQVALWLTSILFASGIGALTVHSWWTAAALLGLGVVVFVYPPLAVGLSSEQRKARRPTLLLAIATGVMLAFAVALNLVAGLLGVFAALLTAMAMEKAARQTQKGDGQNGGQNGGHTSDEPGNGADG